MEKRIEQWGVLYSDEVVRQFVSREEMLASSGQGQANEEEAIHEGKKKQAVHTVGYVGS